MAHEIDMTNGRANMAFTGEVPWHGLGSRLTADADIDTWKTEAGLDWSAVASPVHFQDMEGKDVEFGGRLVLFRSDTGTPLSVVSSRYNPVQPPQVLEFFREYVEALGAFKMHTAGSLRGGKKIWALARAEDDFISLGKGDKIARYLLLATSYDLSIPTLVQQTSVRVVCANTLAASVANAESGRERHIRVQHTATWNAADVKKQLALNEEWAEFTEAVNLLADKKTKDSVAQEFFRDVFYPTEKRDDKAYSEDGADDRVGQLMEVYHAAPGQKLLSAAGTAWGMVNAVTYYVDHVVKSGSQDIRMDKSWFGDGRVWKERAFAQALAFSKN